MLKRILACFLVVPALALLLLWQLEGISPLQIPSAVAQLTGLGAKLACSGHYLSGFDDAQNEGDMRVYSPLTGLLSFHTLVDGGVAASLFGGPTAVARYREGLGCTLEYGPNGDLDTVKVQKPAINTTADWPLGTLTRPADPAIESLLKEILAADTAAGLDTRALLVVQGGQILGEAYAAGIDRHTPLLGWSMGKSVTAILLGRLEALGKISVTQRNLFPEWAADQRSAISLENMLQMSSGLGFEENYVAGSDAARMLFMSPSASDVAMTSPVLHSPGVHLAYSSGTTNLLARLFYDVTGGSAQAAMDFIVREISTPLALEATTFELDASGVFVGSSFLYAPARDWARFGLLMVNGGLINGRQVLEEDWIERAVRPNSSSNEPRYGYQFWLNSAGGSQRWPSLPEGAYAMKGNREQVVMMLPSLEAVIVRLGWTVADYPLDASFARIVARLSR